MRHTLYSDYALRMLMYLAVHPERLCTIEEIANAHGISRNHLMKLAYDLGQAGFVRTVRGRSGGLALGRPPEAINIGELMRHTEEDFLLVECFDVARNRCAIAPRCRMRGIFFEALRAYLAVLDGYSLADVAADPASLRRFLEARPRAASARKEDGTGAAKKPRRMTGTARGPRPAAKSRTDELG